MAVATRPSDNTPQFALVEYKVKVGMWPLNIFYFVIAEMVSLFHDLMQSFS